MGLGDTEREDPPLFCLVVPVAPQAFEPLEQAVELVGIQIELSETLMIALLRDVFSLAEGFPVQLDGFRYPSRRDQCLGQLEKRCGGIRVDTDGPLEHVNTLIMGVELEAEIGEEAVMLGIAGGSGEQVAAGLKGGVAVVQLGLDSSDLMECLGPFLAVDLGQLTEGVGGLR